MLHLTIATHYCGGHFAASNISATGKLATCGMEDPQNGVPLPGKYLSKHCCEDVIVSISTDNNYITSFFSVPDTFQFAFQPSVFTTVSSNDLARIFKLQYPDKSPPGVLMSTKVDLSGICVFRI